MALERRASDVEKCKTLLPAYLERACQKQLRGKVGRVDQGRHSDYLGVGSGEWSTATDGIGAAKEVRIGIRFLRAE